MVVPQVPPGRRVARHVPTSRAAYITSPSSPRGIEPRRAKPTAPPLHLFTRRSGGKCLHRVNLRRRSVEHIRCRGDPRVRCGAGAAAPRAPGLGCGPADPGRAASHPVPDPARPRRPPARVRTGRPDDHDAAAARPRRDPAAAALRVRLLDRPARAAAQPAADLAPLPGGRRRDDSRRRRGRARDDGGRLGRGIRARRRRLADRPDRGDRDRAAPRSPTAPDRHRGGREPRQRRHGARAPPHRAARRRHRRVLRLVGGAGTSSSRSSEGSRSASPSATSSVASADRSTTRRSR